MTKPKRVILVLAGGNALGAYQGGAYEALHGAGLLPHWIAGASIGAINGAMIAGNHPQQRIDKLKQFWMLAEQFGKPDPADPPQAGEGSRFGKRAAAMQSFVTGRPGLFRPRLPGAWSAWPGMPNDVSLFDTSPMSATLRDCVDFDHLNDGLVRFTATALDVETGEDVTFDTLQSRIGPEHLRASAAFPVAYPPVEVEGRLLVDPGISANLPLRAVLATPPDEDTLCIAVDLVAPGGRRPGSLGEAAKRAQDLVFATQARHAIEALGREYRMQGQIRQLSRAGRAVGDSGAMPSVTVLHVPYAEADNETAAKMFDYSAASIRQRWAAGRGDMEAALARLSATPWDRAAFAAYRYEAGSLVAYS